VSSSALSESRFDVLAPHAQMESFAGSPGWIGAERPPFAPTTQPAANKPHRKKKR